MNWRAFKRPAEGLKGLKGLKPIEKPKVDPLKPLKPLKLAEPFFKIARPRLSISRQQLAEEAEHRDDFCNTHRKMIGGVCQHYNVTKGFESGDRVAALNSCLLWRLVNSGRNLEKVDAAEIVGAITVGDVLRWVSVNDKDLEALRKERRLLLTCAESLQGAGNFWEDTS